MLATDHEDVLANNPINLNDILMKETDFEKKNRKKRTRHRPL